MEYTLIKPSFSCYLIGDDHLLVQCAEIILSENQTILGIISERSTTESWALQNKIPYFSSLTNAEHTLSTHSFDYLFSIVNAALLPTELLSLPKKMSINYHNSLLPRYAGAHAPAWAILNNEQWHGITWHDMTAFIDGGNILKQVAIKIGKHETGLSLSIKCYQQALISFRELINELINGSVAITPQQLSRRSYYNFNQKPTGNAWINWNNSAKTIDRIFRALNLGSYHQNRLASPKFKLDDHIYIITKLRLLNEKSAEKPGTIIKILPNGLQIATKTNDLVIGQLYAPNGPLCIVNNIVKKHRLHVGYSLSSPTPYQLSAYEKICFDCSKYELFWVQQLEKFNPAMLPFQPINQPNQTDKSLTHIVSFQLKITNVEKMYALFSSSTILLAVVLVYLYKLGNKENLDFILKDLKAEKKHNFMPIFFSKTIPFSVKFDDNLCFEQVLVIVNNHRMLLNSKYLYEKDVFFRYPELSHSFINQQAITIVIDDEKGADDPLCDTSTNIVIVLSPKNNQINFYVNNTLTPDKNLIGIIKNISNHLHVLLNSISGMRRETLLNFQLLSHEERNKIIYHWSHQKWKTSNKKTIIDLFQDQVEKTPNNIAVSYTKQFITYNELNKISNQFARYLQKNGLKRNEFCAISTDQELYLIISMLSILKAGAAYIPIDITYPEKHINFILNDSKPTILITSKTLENKIHPFTENKKLLIVCFENILKSVQNEENKNLESIDITPESLAYLMYTSGTTGRPKGVMIQHLSVTRLVKNTNYIRISQHDCIAQAASISFDAATFEIWGALLNGARLLSVPRGTLLNIVKFSDLLIQEHVTILWMTSTLFNDYAVKKPSLFKKLTYLLVGGDILNSEQIFNVMNCVDGAPRYILNGYGPTENTTFTTTYLISKERKTYTIPIGKPITNTTVYILDPSLNPVPIGVPGELYTGGDGVSKGYFNQIELTKERFIPDFFSRIPGKNLYKTGDIVRWLPDGNIDYITRQDNQIKICGFRVELEAIRTHLLHHPAISQCVIHTHEDKKKFKILIAYVVANTPISTPDIRCFLEKQLPIYMIPSFFVFLNQMPLTLNGKINHKKLPIPDLAQPLTINNYVKPKTKTEKKLAELWCALFSTNKIGIHNTFFDLGGHSLLITSLLFQLKETMGFDLILHEFLEKPTIKHLAELIDKNSSIYSKDTSNKRLNTDRNYAKNIIVDAIKTNFCPPKTIFITGVTGFLGAHLLYDLYQSTEAIIYCLVRCKDNEDAHSRIDFVLNKYQLTLPNRSRVVPLVGDLSLPNFGLPYHLFLQLANEVDAIYHNGAAVHHLYNYDLLRASNVLSTYEIIKLATLSKLKKIHYISTLSAASNYLDSHNSIIESLIPSNIQSPPPFDGYSQTKWVSEQLLNDAALSGVPIKVYRPGWILGHSITGSVSEKKNHLLLLIKGCIQMKFAPDWVMNLNIMPVDIVSKLITKTSLNDHIKPEVFNIVNPYAISWIDLVHYLNQRGYSISLIPAKKWKDCFLKKISQDNTLYALYALYINGDDLDWMNALYNISSANNNNMLNAFNECNLEPPKINYQLLNIYFSFLEKKGFLSYETKDKS
jgi:amino acid adenylation domain-containing protein/thioester reductase-like protein